MKDAIGSVGPYQILRQWASSASGEIFAAKDERQRSSKKIYALIALAERDSNLRVRDTLKNAVNAAASFTHERVAKMHDVLEHEGKIYVVTDFISGETLAALLRAEEKNLSPMLAVAIATEIARILQDAHSWEDATISKGAILHGDLCPQNVMLTYDGNIMLLNSGLSLAVSRARPDRANLRGHFGYISPERAACSQFLEPNSDIYSLGLMLYEMLTFNKAIKGNTDSELLAGAVAADIAQPSTLIKMSRSLESIVMSAASEDRGRRFASAQDLIEALNKLRTGKRQGWDTRLELEKLMTRHFAHRSRAMRTLVQRWTTGASAIPRSASRPSGRANSGVPGRSTSSIDIPSLSRSTSSIDIPSMPRLTSSLDISPFSTDVSLERVRTDDIPPSTGSMPIMPVPPKQKRRMSFVSGIALCMVSFGLILGSTFFWPPTWKGGALEVARRVGYASERVTKALTELIEGH